MKKAKAILFDLDGTLIDSANGIYNTLYTVLKKNNIEPSIDKVNLKPFLGEGLMTLISKCSPTTPKPTLREYTKEGLKHYANTSINYSTLFPETQRILNFLHESSIPWGIVTNKTRILAQSIIPLLSAYNTIPLIICADDTPFQKPSPKPLLIAAEKLNIIPNETIYLGDSIKDMQAANDAGMIPLIAKYGYISKDYKSWPHQGIINDLSNLKQWL
jgi:N-acetyl-D-muramate 6-phosphate phosphatase